MKKLYPCPLLTKGGMSSQAMTEGDILIIGHRNYVRRSVFRLVNLNYFNKAVVIDISLAVKVKKHLAA